MKSVFNRISVGMMLLSGLVVWLVSLEGHLNFDSQSLLQFFRIFPIAAVASLVGSAIGAGVFALFVRKWRPRWYVRLASAAFSGIAAAAVCTFALRRYALYVSSQPHTTDAPVGVLALFIGLIVFGAPLTISAIVLGTGAGARRN